MSIAVPSNLSFARSINPGQFLFYGDVEGKLVPVKVELATVLGTTSHYMKDVAEAVKSSKGNPLNANPQRVERAYLPQGAETLVVNGSVRVMGSSFTPESCASPAYLEAHLAFLKAFAEHGGFDVLAERYVMNIINGRWLWRNRYSPNVQITVTVNGMSETFDANSIKGGFALNLDALPEDRKVAAGWLIAVFSKALQAKSPADIRFFDISARVLMKEGSEVFPSQEFVENKSDKDGDARIGRVLAKRLLQTGGHQAVMHDQKVGNGLRTIDDWYGESMASPIAVEPYGSVPRAGRAYRVGEGAQSFYQLQDELLELTENIGARWKDALYFGAITVRGGVIGRKSDGKAESKESKGADKVADKPAEQSTGTDGKPVVAKKRAKAATKA